MQKRWYELSPDVCIVISRIELAQDIDRTRYAKKILEELYHIGYKPNEKFIDKGLLVMKCGDGMIIIEHCSWLLSI